MIPLDDLDYYALLEVPREASPDVLRAAFHRFAQLHHPDRHLRSPLDVRMEAQKWFRRGTEAYRVLMAPESRRQYDAGLSAGRLRLDPSARASTVRPSTAPDAPLATASPRARPFLQKALEALERQDWPAAKLGLQLVLQYDPDNEGVRAKLDEVATRGLK